MPHQCVLWKCQCWQSVIEFILANWSNRNHLHPQLWRRCQNLRRWREYQWKRWFCCCCCGNRMWRRSKKLFVPGREVYTYVGFEDKITVSSGPTKKEPRREAHSLTRLLPFFPQGSSLALIFLSNPVRRSLSEEFLKTQPPSWGLYNVSGKDGNSSHLPDLAKWYTGNVGIHFGNSIYQWWWCCG